MSPLLAEQLDSDHWAYRSPQRPTIPTGDEAAWSVNAIDTFVLAELAHQKIAPATLARRERLLRRVSFGLVGLPPTLRQIDHFLNDQAPDAYERVVDGLLASPRYGERMAVSWLDLARYADTHGYHMDSHRDMWRWRDWVIGAFNRNLSFDRFTLQQLAGDLLVARQRGDMAATEAVRNDDLPLLVATGFNRNNMINFEAGAIAEEYRIEYVADRVNTTATVWLGQTFRCARCHDHKYDPISQRDYYRFFAFFNSVPEKGLDGRTGNAEPTVKAPTDRQQLRLSQYKNRDREFAAALQQRAEVAKKDQKPWERQLLAGEANLGALPEGMVFYTSFDQNEDGVLVDEVTRISAETHGKVTWTKGKFSDALLLTGKTHATFDIDWDYEFAKAFSISAWVFPTSTVPMTLVSRTTDQELSGGFNLWLENGHVLVDFRLNADRILRVRTRDQLQEFSWHHISASCDSSRGDLTVQIFIDGDLQATDPVDGTMDKLLSTGGLLSIGRLQTGSEFRGILDEVRIYDRALSIHEIALLAGADPIGQFVRIPAEQRTLEQLSIVRQHFLENVDSRYRKILDERRLNQRRQQQLERSIVATMVMQDMETSRDTFVLNRGDYRATGEKVTAGTPEFLPPLTEEASRDRLGLAQWLMDHRNPLTARVAINRLWQAHFGQGIVPTSENFGTRGEHPSHLDLLDWLAVEFRDTGWNVKRMHRLIVTSAAYQQSARTVSKIRQFDPSNQWLARGPRRRLEAEAIRDHAIAVSRLMVNTLGGVSVSPYHPAGLWEELSYNPDDYTAQIYQQSQRGDLYRRGVYTFWKRSVPPVFLEAFDAPNRESCTTRRGTSNTPLQMLILKNSPIYVEAARALAERVMAEGGSTKEQRLEFIWRLVTSRRPTENERVILGNLFAKQLATFRQDSEAAKKYLSVGDSAVDERLEPAELAAWSTVASAILGLDEAISY